MPRSPRPPMREPSYFVLAALLDGPRHGYVVIQRVAELSGDRVRLAAGSLYSVLDRLLGEGLVAVTGEEIVNGRARRYYALTDTGREALNEEAARMAEAARIVTERAAAPAPRTLRVRPA
ncbi:PadR family transcriptional regulator [Dactylosporangium sp. CA-139114]|uniref:PadR family transcriptional regulator n=1 Tax=Dactylosporangium sp. CA-139114 TaxID=3239931 RepID=UPI003D95F5EA